MYGVSPAYFFSSFGPAFRPSDIEAALPGLRELGYESFQAEAFEASVAESWSEGDSKRLAARAGELGLVPGPFVAHWLGAGFASDAALRTPGLPAGAPRALAIASALSGLPVFAVPLPALAVRTDAAGGEPAAARTELRGALIEKLGQLAEAAGRAGFRLALELLPGNALGGSREFLDLLSVPGFEDLGIVLDTGHFHAMGENVAELPARLAGAVAATHLCDNDGRVNLSLAPGRGRIPFDALMPALRASGYAGSLDLEIVCPARDTAREYGNALETLRALEFARPGAGPPAELGGDRILTESRGSGARETERSPV